MSIIKFLEARIAEDEASAMKAAASTDAHSISGRGHAVGAVWTPYAGSVLGAEAEGYPVALWDDEGSTTLQMAPDAASHVASFDPARVLSECAAKRSIIKQHEDWPVLVEQEPEFGPPDVTDGSYFAYSMSRKIAWLTEREYVKHFGSEPPTAPMIRTLAAIYSDHPDYQEDWA